METTREGQQEWNHEGFLVTLWTVIVSLLYSSSMGFVGIFLVFYY